MAHDANRRLRALERKAPATNQAEFERLMLLAKSGQLEQADLSRLSDEQVWWLVAQAPVAVPPDEQLERIAKEVSGWQGLIGG